MGVVLMAFGWLRGPFMGFLRGIPPAVWYAIAAALAMLAIWHWHTGKVDAAYIKGAHEQNVADLAAFTKAANDAKALQHATVEKTAAKSDGISKETGHAFDKTAVDLARGVADLRMRWAAYYASVGIAGQGGAATPASAAAAVDGPACVGTVDLETAIASAEAADRSAAQVNGWIDWYQMQAAAWPASEPVATPRPNEVTP